MKAFNEIINVAMKENGYSVRSLERAIVDRYGEEKKISRSLISDYKIGKRAPTYEGTILLAEILNVDKEELLVAAFKLKREVRDESEWERFNSFCNKHSIKIAKTEAYGDRNRKK